MPSLIVYCGDDAKQQMAALHGHQLTMQQTWQQFCQIHNSDSVKQKWHHYHHGDLAICVHGHNQDTGISQAEGIVLAFEGFVTHTRLSGEKLRQSLITDFIRQGEQCTKQWQGSFRVVIHCDNITRVYADHLANRPIFYLDDNQHTVYCSHAEPLKTLLNQPTIDGANLLQFIANGRFFAQGSLFTQLKQIPPGTAHQITNHQQQPATISTFCYYRYRLNPPQPKPTQIQAQELLPQFKQLLDLAILKHWQRAENPILKLSGGYDSRYILNTLAQHLSTEQFNQLSTIMCAEPNQDPNSDSQWAKREAQRHQIEFNFYPVDMPTKSQFELMFMIQSGMTANVFSHSNNLHWCTLLVKQGKRSLFWGDEIFGADGEHLTSREQALAKVGLAPLTCALTDIFDHNDWLNGAGFNQDISDWREAHQAQLEKLSQIADEPNDLRDTLYCTERLPAFINQLKTHRSQFIENFTPLLDRSLLEFNSRLPRQLRTDKALFRQCFKHYYPTEGFAFGGNEFNWQRCWQESSVIEFIEQQLAQLPAPFNAKYWLKLAQAPKSKQATPIHIKALQIAIRAMVLGRWLKT